MRRSRENRAPFLKSQTLEVCFFYFFERIWASSRQELCEFCVFYVSWNIVVLLTRTSLALITPCSCAFATIKTTLSCFYLLTRLLFVLADAGARSRSDGTILGATKIFKSSINDNYSCQKPLLSHHFIVWNGS